MTPRRTLFTAVLLAGLFASALPGVRAQDTSWTAGDGDWSNAANWDNGLPNSLGNALLKSTDPTNRTVTFNTSSTPAGMNIDSTGTGLMTLHITGGTFTTTQQNFIGHDGRGAVQHTGGTYAPNSLIIANIPGSGATYVLSGTGSLSVTTFSYLGNYGTATFNQSGGTHTQGTNLSVGVCSTGGPYVCGSGNGVGTYNLSGGTHQVLGRLSLGLNAGGTGTYNLSGTGILTNVNDAQRVGYSGTGTFNQTGGANTAKELLIAVNPGSSGTYNLAGGALNAGKININANGALNYSGGSITLGGGAGTLTNAAGGQVNVSGGGALTLDGNVDNAGQFKVTGTTITYTGTFTNTGSYVSDPSTNIFGGDLVISGSGFLSGGVGDIFQIGGGFRNSSTNSADWDTDTATLIFNGTGEHLFGVASAVGARAFEWGDIVVGAGAKLRFYDGNTGNNGMALYVGVLDVDDSLGLDALLFDGPLTIYFDRTAPENDYLVAALNNPGQLPTGLTLVGVPEPGTLALLGLGLAGLAASRRRKQ